MTTYTFSQARQKLASVLDQASADGEVIIKRKDGSLYQIKPISKNESPLDVEGVDTQLSMEEIVDFIRESRER